jgi:Flp pilus assembly pilin Flp
MTKEIEMRFIQFVRRGLPTDNRGAVPVEYIAVFAFVSIVLAISLVKLGPTLLAAWGTSEHLLLANKP